MVPFSEATSKPVDWLWENHFARGKVSLVVGNPGVGKSIFTIDYAARASRGGAWPDGATGSGKPASTVFLANEDSLEDTMKPRAEIAQADISKLHLLQTVRQTN